MDLDHVAIAVPDVNPTIAELVGDLGALVQHGGPSPGFRAMQMQVGEPDGMIVELLEPFWVERNDFLKRFLDRHGPGPHHMTFKTDNLAREIERFRAAGIDPVNIDLSSPSWKEAFVMPRDGGGTVVQLAQAGYDNEELMKQMQELREQRRQQAEQSGGWGPWQWWSEPPERAERRAVLRRVVLRTPSVGAVVPLFVELLGGTRETEGEGFLQLVWPGGGRVRFEVAPDQKPGVDRLELEWDGEPTERIIAGTRFVISQTP